MSSPCETWTLPTLRLRKPSEPLGFRWFTTRTDVPIELPGDRWCMRNAFCELFRWPVGGAEWSSFIEGPEPEDLERLVMHLGLEALDPLLPAHARQLAQSLDHPGISSFDLHAVRVGHVIYQPHLRFPRPLPLQFRSLQPDLVSVIVYARQAPHPR